MNEPQNSQKREVPDLYVQAAFLCNGVSADEVGTVNFHGVRNKIQVRVSSPKPGAHMPSITHDIQMALGFSSERYELRGKHSVTVQQVLPDGTVGSSWETTFTLPEAELMTPALQKIEGIPFPIEGTYWFEVLFRGRIITKIPLQVNYVAVPTE